MKLNGIFGTGSGKVGNSVWAVSSGVQIVRPYQPNVTNPNTDAQVEQRAKLKLMSQLAAALAPGIAFKKQGLVSARNQFIAANIKKALMFENKVTVDLTSIDLTGSLIAFPAVTAAAGEGNTIRVSLDKAAASSVAAVVYVEAGYSDEQQISLLEVKAVSEAGQDRHFATTMRSPDESCVVLAYGIHDSGDGRIKSYADYYATSNDWEGVLELVKKSVAANASFTKTVGAGLNI